MTARRPIPEPLEGPSFSVGAALRVGVSPSRLRAPDLDAPFTGIRAVKPDTEPPLLDFDFAAATRSIIQLARQYAPRLKPGQFFCEMTAIALHGLPVPSPRLLERDVHVAVPFPRTAPRARGMIGHQFSINHVFYREGLPVSSAIDAWIDCAGRCSVDELVVIGDGLLRRQDPLAAADDLLAAVRAQRHRPGHGKLMRALVRMRAGTDSPKETELRLLIVDAGLPEPVVNEPIFDDSGQQVGIADLAYPKWKVLIEYLGGYHFYSADQRRKDLDRLAALADAGWRVVEVHKDHLVRQRATVLSRIRRALDDAGWEP